jgi:hypothetical protein
MFCRTRFGALALAAGLAACDRPAPTAVHDDLSPSSAVSPPSLYTSERGAMDRLARRLALALADQEFRTQLKRELDRSPFDEQKLHVQRLLQGGNRRMLKEVARLSSSSEQSVEADVRASIPVELYFPVQSHRAAWKAGPEVLVASARTDREAPIAYDTKGRRHILSPDRPPAMPVLAVVPVETDFSKLRIGTDAICQDCAPEPPLSSPLPSGLYMTYSHFVQDFEGWLKGKPEFEFHILGQSGTSDSLRDYQCAGAATGGYYYFDQNELNWSGRVLLFTQAQLTNYKTAHPNQNFRIIALEDDDTGCAIKFDGNRFKNLISTISSYYPNLTGSKDTTSGIVKYVKRANALQKILAAAYSFITTQDDLIGNAVEDVVVGVTYPGANWIIKGENNSTQGWIKLEMR